MPLNIEERITTLSLHASRWESLNFASEYTIPVRNGDYWELYGNVLAQSVPNTTRIEFEQLSAPARGVVQERWSMEYLDPNARECDFIIDPAQDLLIVVGDTFTRREFVSSEEAGYRFHIRDLRTGGDHPEAIFNPALVVFSFSDPDPDVCFHLKTAGDFFGVRVEHSDDSESIDELRIWNWKTGVLHLHLTGYINEMLSFPFLSETHIVVAFQAGITDPDCNPYLKIIAFDESRSTSTGIARAQYNLALDLPAFAYSLAAGSLRLDCDGSRPRATVESAMPPARSATLHEPTSASSTCS